ncbi:MAG: hypothetical protein HUJ42_02780 [Malacoplasma sp.]|nr:hypothetical protein [Malacoplasma sp.]
MKIRKYKWLLSLTTIAAVLTPIAIFNGSNQNNTGVISKLNAVNNAESEIATTPAIPESVPIAQINHLAPNADDLYNEYAYDSGYVIKDETNHMIYFYSWFKEEIWHVTLSAIPSFPTDKTISTMNVKGALKADATFDTKLFVYGNFQDGGSYLFELDMTNGSLIENSLITNTTVDNSVEDEASGTKPDPTNNSNLISDANLLTVIDANTVIVTPKNIHHTTTTTGSGDQGSNLISFSEIKFTQDDKTAPTITTFENIDLGTSSLWTYGQIIGVIYSNNRYMFATTAIGAVNSNKNYAVSVFEWYLKKSDSDGSFSVTATNFNQTSSIGGNTTNKSFDYMYMSKGIELTDVDASSSSVSTDVATLQKYLDEKCSNFSVKYTGSIEKPRMLISLNWDSTNLTLSTNGNNGSDSNNGYNKILVSTFDDGANGTGDPKLATYTINTSTNLQSTLTYLGISNLIYTRDANVAPYAVCVAAGASGNNMNIYFNFVKLEDFTNNSEGDTQSSTSPNDITLTNNTSTSSSNNDKNFSNNNQTNNWWFSAPAEVLQSGKTYNASNVNKLDFFLNFIPGTGLKSGTEDSSTTTYFGYISAGAENTESTGVNYEENYFSIPATMASTSDIPIKDLKLNDFEWGNIQTILNNEFKATTSTDTIISPNSFATNATTEAIGKKIAELLPKEFAAYTVNYPTGEDTTDGTTAAVSGDASPYANTVNGATLANPDLQYSQESGIIRVNSEKAISFEVNNWWNNGKTVIGQNPNTFSFELQLNKVSDFAFANDAVSKIADTNADNTAIVDYVEAKYPIATFTQNSTEFKANFKNFISDSLSQLGAVDLGPILKDVILNNIQSAINGADQNQQDNQVANNSVVLHSSDNADPNSYKVGNYITVNSDTNNNSVTITYDLSGTGVPNVPTTPITLTYKNFSATADPSTFDSYNTWKEQKQAASQNTPVTPQPGDNNNNNNSNNNATSSQLEGWKIALIVIAVILVIAIIVGIYFWMKKRNTARYSN